MNKRIFTALFLVVVLAFGLVACGGTSTKLTIGTGGSGGTYYAFGTTLGQYVEEVTGIKCTAVESDGSKANIIGIASGDYQLGTVQSDVMAYAFEGSKTFADNGKVDSFRVIGGLYAEAVQLITTDADIKSVADLKGKSVSIGAPNSGVYFNAMDILGAANITLDDIDEVKQSFNDSVESLKDGKIDAAFIVAGAPTAAVTDLMNTTTAYLVPIDGEIADAVMGACPYYTKAVIPAETYKGQTEDVTTITVKATLIVKADIDEDTVYNITKTIFDNAEAITARHAKGAELSIENATEGMAVPFHKGAAKYFAEKGVTVTAE